MEELCSQLRGLFDLYIHWLGPSSSYGQKFGSHFVLLNPHQKKKHYDWKLLRSDADLQLRFRVEHRNRYSELYDENSSVTEQYDTLVKANAHAAEAILPLVKKSKQERFSNNQKVMEARKRVEKLAHSYKIKKSSITRKHPAAAKQRLNEKYKRLETDRLKAQFRKQNLLLKQTILHRHGRSLTPSQTVRPHPLANLRASLLMSAKSNGLTILRPCWVQPTTVPQLPQILRTSSPKAK